MRTRFLATDFFFLTSANESAIDFRFIPLPPPPSLSDSDPQFELQLPCFNLDLDLESRSEIDVLPIEPALSEVLSDVLPRFCPAGDAGTGVNSPRNQISLRDEELTAFPYEEKEGRKSPSFKFDTSAIEVGDGTQLEKELRFEIVEVELPLGELTSFSEKQMLSSELCFEVPSIQMHLDMIDVGAEVTVNYPHDIVESICPVESTPSIPYDDEDSSCTKVASSSAHAALNHMIDIPQFEVRGSAWELDYYMSATKIFNSLLPTVEPYRGGEHEELLTNTKDLLGSATIDVFTCLSGDVSFEHCHREEPTSIMSLLEMDFINLEDNVLLQRSSRIYPIDTDGACSDMPCYIALQEVQIFDIPSHDIFEMVVNLQMPNSDVSDLMCKEDVLSGTLYESIVSSELALADDVFKSLPAPVLSDDKTINVSSMLGDLLCNLKPHPLSACDGIYLDWHLLLEDTCNREICSMYARMVEGVTICDLASEQENDLQLIMGIDINFLDDIQESRNMTCHKEVPNELDTVVFEAHHTSKDEVSREQKDKINYTSSEGQLKTMNSGRVASLFQTLSQSSELSFFLDVRRGSTGKDFGIENLLKVRCTDALPSSLSKEQCVPSVVPKVNLGQWDIKIHCVGLPSHIVSFINHIQKCYVAISEDSINLRHLPTKELHTISRQTLLDLIIGEGTTRLNNGNKDENTMEYVELFVLKQLTYFLCFFGVHTAHQYLSNLTASVGNMPERLRYLKILLENIHFKAEKQLIESHPALTLIEQILRSNWKNGQKILVVANRVFWLPLTQKLSTLNISSHELRELNKHDSMLLTNFVLEGLLQSDCLLLDINDISTSFPFNKFSIILEYGGPYPSSRLYSLAPELDGLPSLHFLHIKMDDHSLPDALFDDYVPSQYLEPLSESSSYSARSLPVKPSKRQIIESLTFVPTADKNSWVSSESTNQTDASHDKQSGVHIPYAAKTKNGESRRSSFPDIVIIVNTQASMKNMLVSRRSSYQKILSLEKGGAQVVEREIDLPLDLIFSAAVCLVWYETRTFGDKTATPETSSVPAFMENIATNVLMSLSFAFSGCILVFEGESNFLSLVMESSDCLYAAAASLDINLQLFCSHTSESTDEIILGCIRNTMRSNRGLFPPMPEAETLGESFLTRFPSINPLAAHAILSSGGTLVEFLEWSHQCRIQAVGKYLLSEESISLFSALCRYGELGESKSVMTDCSSVGEDVSSPIVKSPRKRKKCSSHMSSMPIGDPYADPFDQFSTDHIELPQMSSPHQLRKPFSIEGMPKKTNNHIFDQILRRRHGMSSSTPDYYGRGDIIGNQSFDEDCSDEFIHRKQKLGSSFSWRPDSSAELPVRNPLPASGFSFSSYPTFPTSGEITDSTTNLSSLKGDKFFGEIDRSSCEHDIDNKNHECSNEKFIDRSCIFQFANQDKRQPRNRAKSYTNSAAPQGPLWKLNFLNRGNEKAADHQQTLQCNTCPSCVTRSREKKTSNRQSPSVIDAFRYQGGSQARKTQNQKWRKDVKVVPTPSNEKRKNPSFIIDPTWTPVDKRARQKLSFTRYGNEKQSKLAWRNNHSPAKDHSLMKRY